jgi:hypothetical protein
MQVVTSKKGRIIMNNGKKEFPINGLEQDCTSKWGRKYYCYIHNIPGIKRYVKNQMNRRFRRFNKKLTREL